MSDPIDSVYTRVASALARLLPPEIRAECDRILGDSPEPRERWSMYDCTLNHLEDVKNEHRAE